MSISVDSYIANASPWQKELAKLRTIILTCPLQETIKWNAPCYTKDQQIVLNLGALKNHCVIGFFKGVYLKDKHKLLRKPGPNTQESRVLRFTSLEEIEKYKPVILSYIQEALDLPEAPSLIKEKPKLVLVEELVDLINQDPPFKSAFEALTAGRQRGYNIYFAGAKQAKTRVARIEKNRGKIMLGYGLHDCTCGLSKRMPTCDGSHKTLSDS